MQSPTLHRKSMEPSQKLTMVLVFAVCFCLGLDKYFTNIVLGQISLTVWETKAIRNLTLAYLVWPLLLLWFVFHYLNSLLAVSCVYLRLYLNSPDGRLDGRKAQ